MEIANYYEALQGEYAKAKFKKPNNILREINLNKTSPIEDLLPNTDYSELVFESIGNILNWGCANLNRNLRTFYEYQKIKTLSDRKVYGSEFFVRMYVVDFAKNEFSIIRFYVRKDYNGYQLLDIENFGGNHNESEVRVYDLGLGKVKITRVVESEMDVFVR